MHSYAYDFRNLMTDYDGPGTSNDTTYKYDASGRRITKDVNGTKTAYFHDRLNVVAEYNGSNELQRTYVTLGLDHNLSLTASGTTYYYLSEALGSIRQVIDANEATQNSYDYFAFGKVFGTPTENVTQPFRFTGRSWDPETQLYYYRVRNYAAPSGRFRSRDPLWPYFEVNSYRYASNAPGLLSDPLGLTSVEKKAEPFLAKALCLLKEVADWAPSTMVPEGAFDELAQMYMDSLTVGDYWISKTAAGKTSGAHIPWCWWRSITINKMYLHDQLSDLEEAAATLAHEWVHYKGGLRTAHGPVRWLRWLLQYEPNPAKDAEGGVRRAIRMMGRAEYNVCCPDGSKAKTSALTQAACKCDIQSENTCPCKGESLAERLGCPLSK